MQVGLGTPAPTRGPGEREGTSTLILSLEMCMLIHALKDLSCMRSRMACHTYHAW